MLLSAACAARVRVRARATRRARALAAWVIASRARARHPLLRVAGGRARGGLAAGRPPPQSSGADRGRGRRRCAGSALIPLALSQNGTGNASWIAPIPLGPRLGADRAPVPGRLPGARRTALLEPRASRDRRARVSSLLALRSDRVERRAARCSRAAIALVGLRPEPAAGRRRRRRPDHPQRARAVAAGALIVVAGGLGASARGLARDRRRPPCCVRHRDRGAPSASPPTAASSGRTGARWRARSALSPAPAVAARAILVQHYRDLLPLSLYVPGLKFWRRRSAVACQRARRVSITARRACRFCWWGAACNLSPSTDAGVATRSRASTSVWRRHAYQFTVMRLVVADGRSRSRPPIVSRGAAGRRRFRRDELLIQRALVSARDLGVAQPPVGAGRQVAELERAEARPARAARPDGRRARTSA